MNKNKPFIQIHHEKDLIEIDAHYYQGFTTTADGDVEELIDFLQAYIAVPEDQVPDVSLSIACDQTVIVKNLSLSKSNIHTCAEDILQGSVDIVSKLALAALHSTSHKFTAQKVSEVTHILSSRIEQIQDLQALILEEHGEEVIEHYEGMEIS